MAPRPLSVVNNKIFELPRTEQSKPAGNSRSPVKAGDLGVSVVNPFLLDACGNHVSVFWRFANCKSCLPLLTVYEFGLSWDGISDIPQHTLFNSWWVHGVMRIGAVAQLYAL